MGRCRENGYCCGGGGGGMWLDGFNADKVDERLSERRVREAAASGADILAVCCPYEVSRFSDAAKATGNDSLQVLDIAEMLDRAMRLPPDGVTMRVLDFGTTTAVRSQSSWHALARCAQAGDGPTLSFVRPAQPYVCLGFHRQLAEIDTDWCAENDLPVLRRMVGGGPVYLDADQLFFQITLPARTVTGSRERALAALLTPAVEALRTLGVEAALDPFGEISVGGAKVCGHGAGQLRDGVVVVGNLITAFDHERAARMLALSSRSRIEVLDLMRRHVTATAVDPAEWQQAMVAAYARHFGLDPEPGEPTAPELAEADRLDGVLGSAEFVAGADQAGTAPGGPTAHRVKIRGGIYVEVAAA